MEFSLLFEVTASGTLINECGSVAGMAIIKGNKNSRRNYLKFYFILYKFEESFFKHYSYVLDERVASDITCINGQ
jgi:hypothetical protein